MNKGGAVTAIRVLVVPAKDIFPRVCRLGRTGWRCGKCLRGLVPQRVGGRCRVCGAHVMRVEFPGEVK